MLRCLNCGMELKGKMEYCPNCGWKIDYQDRKSKSISGAFNNYIDSKIADKAEKERYYQRHKSEIDEENRKREEERIKKAEEDRKRLEAAQKEVKKKLPAFYIITSIVLFVLIPLFIHWFLGSSFVNIDLKDKWYVKWLIILVVMGVAFSVKNDMGYRYYYILGKRKEWSIINTLLSLLCLIECIFITYNDVSRIEQLIMSVIIIVFTSIFGKH